MRDSRCHSNAREIDREFPRNPSECASTRLAPIGRTAVGLIGIAFVIVSWLATSSSSDEPAAMAPDRSSPRPPQTIAWAFSPDSKTVATVDTLQRVTVRDLADGLPVIRQFSTRDHSWAVAYSPDGKWLALGGAGDDIIACELGAGGSERPLGVPIRGTTAIALTPDGETLIATSEATTEIVVWDLARGAAKMTLRGHASPPSAIALSRDGKSLASAEKMMPAIEIWDLGTGRKRLTLQSPGRRHSLSFSRDGTWIAAAGGYGHRIRVWNSVSGEELPTIAPGADACLGAAFSADGRLIATIGHDGKVRLRDIASGAELQCLPSTDLLLLDLAFSPDGRMLVARKCTGGIERWAISH
jgi:COMPASS component SWD3